MYQQSVSNYGLQYDAGLRQFMLGVFNNMAVGLAVSAFVAYFVGTSPTLLQMFFGGPQKWLVILAPLAFVLVLSFGISRMSVFGAMVAFFAFAAVMGLSLSTIMAVYTASSIASAFFSTAIMFGAMSIYGYTTKRDLTKIGTFLIMGALGLCFASLINLFLQSSALAFAVSCIAVVVFAGLTAWDVQNLRNLYDELEGDEREKAGVMGALSLYLNFVNIFTSLLQLFGERKE